jgi:hypothetical protein
MPSPDGSRTVGAARVSGSPAQVPDHDALRAFFSGKRRSDRRPVRLRVDLHGDGKRVVGRSVDVSEGGVLVRIPDDEASPPPPMPAMLETLKLLEEHFQKGVVLGFPSIGIRVPVTPIRLASQPDDAPGFLLGFRFDRALEPDEGAKLVPASAAIRGPLATITRDGVALQALVFVESPVVVGPVLVGRVWAHEASTLDVRVESTAAAPTSEAASALLRDRPARLRLLEAGRTLWEGPVHVVATTDAADGFGGTDVRVEAEGVLPPALARRFRPRG